MSNRRLPVYILIDTSGSMNGEPIHSVNTGLQNMLSTLKQDPFALESVWLSLITFNNEVKEVIPLMQLEDVVIPEIVVPKSGATFMGAALELLFTKISNNTIKTTQEEKGDWRPLLFIMTDGRPSDIQAFEYVVPKIKALNFAAIIACAAGPKAKKEDLLTLTDKVVILDVMDSASFSNFFKWLSSSVSYGSNSVGLAEYNALPPPPPEIQLAI